MALSRHLPEGRGFPARCAARHEDCRGHGAAVCRGGIHRRIHHPPHRTARYAAGGSDSAVGGFRDILLRGAAT